MNSKVKRYDPINNDGTCGMCVEDADCGAYVEHADYAALEAECERLLAGRQMLIGDLERLDATVEMLRAELEGANERARILLDAKNHWAERARKAEAELAAIKGQELRADQVKAQLLKAADNAVDVFSDECRRRLGEIEAVQQLAAAIAAARKEGV